MGNMTPTRGRPPQAYIIKVSWPIEGIPIAPTKNLSILLCFYPFYLNSPLQTLCMFSIHPDGGLRHSRWPCRPRKPLRQALPNGAPPRGAIQGDRCEFMHSTDPDSFIFYILFESWESDTIKRDTSKKF
jgi:hypothetical protein